MWRTVLVLAVVTVPSFLMPAGAGAQVDTEILLPCTSARQELNFPTYWLGPTFEGLELSTVLLDCHLRGTTTTLIYGDCTYEDCSPTIQIQNWPSHMRNKGMYSAGFPPRTDEMVDGVPATRYQGHFEVYHPETTVVIFGDAAPKGYVAGFLEEAPRIPARMAVNDLEFEQGCIDDPQGCQADGGDGGMGILSLVFLGAVAVPLGLEFRKLFRDSAARPVTGA